MVLQLVMVPGGWWLGRMVKKASDNGEEFSLPYGPSNEAKEETAAAVEAEASDKVADNVVNAAKLAATLMAMNNVYYRFLHLSTDKQFSKLPAGLRMNAMANPGVEKADFELYSLAVSALNGCGLCIDSHVKTLLQHDVSAQAVQTSIKLAAVLNAAATARKLS